MNYPKTLVLIEWVLLFSQEYNLFLSNSWCAKKLILFQTNFCVLKIICALYSEFVLVAKKVYASCEKDYQGIVCKLGKRERFTGVCDTENGCSLLFLFFWELLFLACLILLTSVPIWSAHAECCVRVFDLSELANHFHCILRALSPHGYCSHRLQGFAFGIYMHTDMIETLDDRSRIRRLNV